MAEHELRAALGTCMDSRFQDFIDRWKEEKGLTDGNHDRISLAGAAGCGELLWEQIELSLRLHNTREVHVVEHADCGYYREVLGVAAGDPDEYSRHVENLRALKGKIAAAGYHVNFFGYYATLDENGIADEIVPVEI